MAFAIIAGIQLIAAGVFWVTITRMESVPS
jgi:hypothetical protein